MQLTAKLTQLLPLQSGTSAKGQWKKQDIIVETDGQFPKKVCISIWGDKANENMLQIGNVLKLEFDAESREFNGKWYTDLKAWKIELAEGGSSTGGSSAASSLENFSTPPPPDALMSENSTDDLPF